MLPNTDGREELRAVLAYSGNMDLAISELPEIDSKMMLAAALLNAELPDAQQMAKVATIMHLLHVLDYHAVALAASVSDLDANQLALSYNRLLEKMLAFTTDVSNNAQATGQTGALSDLVGVLRDRRLNAGNN